MIEIDSLLVSCWCEAQVVRLPRAEVLACRTRTCGRPECRERLAVTG